MAKQVITEVTYDVDPAMAELDKLDQKLRMASDSATQSFDKIGSASEGLERGLSGLGGTVGNTFNQLRAFAIEFGAIGVVAGTVAASLSAVIAELVDIPDLTKDSAAETEALNSELQKQLDLQIQLSDIQDARIFRALTEQQRELTQKRSAIALEQNVLDEQREIIKNRLDEYNDFYDELDDRAKESARERESLEQKLTRLSDRAEARATGNLPIGRQIQELLSRSEKLSGEGEFDRAEQFLEKARRIADSSGDQSGFFNRQVETTEGRLAAAIKSQIDARNLEEKAIKKQQDAIQALIDTKKAEDDQLKGSQRQLRRDVKDIRSEGQQIQLQRGIARDEDQAADATLERAAAHQQIINLMNTERSLLQKITALGRTTSTVFFGAGASGLTEQIKQMKEAQDLFVSASSRLSNRTTTDDEAAGQQITEVRKLVAELEAKKQGGGLSSALNFNLENLQKALDIFDKILAADEKLEASGRSRFRAADEGVFQVPGTPAASVPANPVPAQQPPPPGVPAQSVASNQTINVNAEVKGGIIDAETTRTIVDIIRKELRKGTVQRT